MHLPADIIRSLSSSGRIYEVGGAVRDRLRHSLCPDSGRIDVRRFWAYPAEEVDYLVTGLPMEALLDILGRYGRVGLAGRAFGVIKFSFRTEEGSRRTTDIALPRREVSTGHGHRDFLIEYDSELPVEQDLGRRDFTVNAIALRLRDGRESQNPPELIDPFSGMRDIGDRLIRMVSPAAFTEDPLRMLRACQFAARFQFSLEQKTFRSIRRHAPLIRSVSPERIRQELDKILLKADQPSIGLWLMQRSGLLREVLPELEAGVDVTQPGSYHRYKVFEHCIKTVDIVPASLEMRLAALLHDVAKPQCREAFQGGVHFYGHDKLGEGVARRVLERFRYSGDTIAQVSGLVRNHMFAYPETEKGLRRLIARVGAGGLDKLVELRRADIKAQGRGTEQADRELEAFRMAVAEAMEKNPPFTVKDLQVDGQAIMEEFKLKPGPRVGQVIRHLLEYVLDHPERNRREELLDEAARWISEKASGF